jgi:hypothetical protein
MSEGSAEGEIYMDEDSFVMTAEIKYTENNNRSTLMGPPMATPREEPKETEGCSPSLPPTRTIGGGEAFIYARPEPLGPVADKNGKMPIPDVGDKRELGQFKNISKTVRR